MNETPHGVAKMHTRADALPSSHVVNESEAVAGYAQFETAIGTFYCFGFGRKRFGLTHATRPRSGMKQIENVAIVREGATWR
jgi:hypothetical protein